MQVQLVLWLIRLSSKGRHIDFKKSSRDMSCEFNILMKVLNASSIVWLLTTLRSSSSELINWDMMSSLSGSSLSSMGSLVKRIVGERLLGRQSVSPSGLNWLVIIVKGVSTQ